MRSDNIYYGSWFWDTLLAAQPVVGQIFTGFISFILDEESSRRRRSARADRKGQTAVI